ncbi:T9SS type A sorting domain-containing protein [Hymenobacter convexus]|uniref:T9SS type A sorting domain-containing protein n=1 Tax=Hymenobacter sp. CA1UV-4 TaxID=3063782 RepID=UPI00272D837D|nr:T9SS type A sorting domain-containing protein [Hymenobacter sp. CA1UV-4]
MQANSLRWWYGMLGLLVLLTQQAARAQTPDPGFQATLVYQIGASFNVPGQINDVVQLPGGGYIVGGNFTQINGVARTNLAKLSATGVPDATWPAAAGPDREVRAVLVQPDGKVLVGGDFQNISGASRAGLARLLPNGTLDAAFAPPFAIGSINRVAVLPSGRVFAAGTTQLTGATTSEDWLRSLDGTTGQADLSFPRYNASDLVVQPNGKLVVAGFYNVNGARFGSGSCVFRLLPSGGLDPSFTAVFSLSTGLGGGPVVTAIGQDLNGDLYYTSYFYTDTSPFITGASLNHLLPNGGTAGSVQNLSFANTGSLAVQPNGRVLLGTRTTLPTSQPGLSRVLGTLAPDASFLPANGPTTAVKRILVQADGAIMVAGSFLSVGGQTIIGLVRLLDGNVLKVSSQQLMASTQAWPVPANGQLHLSLDAASRPQHVELLDALGRVVLARAVGQPEMALDVARLQTGAYVLRVQYADGFVTRRIAVE